ncbi:mitochondrial carrier [Flagelloscypha sp. PMI_526]|nr:mitochondrial carrier [Flagelloscypha sp. PMI_526]
MASSESVQSRSWLPAKSWAHFVAGGLGGMTGAIVTSPFDVVKTRLQSNLFSVSPAAYVSTSAGGSATLHAAPARNLLYHFIETGHILRDIYTKESPSALFKGLGPTLVGVVPARSINFFTYGNGKQVLAQHFNNGHETPLIHLSAAALAGIATGTATNPIWVVKTRMQLSASKMAGLDSTPRTGLASSLYTIRHIYAHEGVRGFYKGLTASYLGVTEGVIQWTLYEQLKSVTQNAAGPDGRGGVLEWAGMLTSAGVAKCCASLITYPHEVLRTRLRQPAVNGVIKYTGLVQTLRLVLQEEGARSLYGGLSAHLMRVIPNAAVMYSIYEAVLRWA